MRASRTGYRCFSREALLAALLCSACADKVELPTGVTLTIVSVPIVGGGAVTIDAFRLRVSVDGAEPLEHRLDLGGRAARGSESVNLLFDAEDDGKQLTVVVEGLAAADVVGGGRAEARIVAHTMAPAEALLRSCAAADGAFCDGADLITCDAADRTVRTPCAFGCDGTAASCLACAPSTVSCDGDLFVVCGAAGQVLVSEDCALLSDPCAVGQCSESGCVAVPQGDGQPCDDGLFCTEATACSAGVCGGGTPRGCDDGNGCTFDTCDEQADSCAADSLPFNGAPCSDGSYCLVGKSCDDGLCGGGASRDCDDGNACTQDGCNESTAACEHQPVSDGGSCDDGDYCTIGESCSGGVCGNGAARSCDDANICTDDSCDTAGRVCQHAAAADGIACDDGSFCVVAKSCAAGVCSGGAPRDCGDGNVCTFDSCDEAGRRCVNDPAPLDSAPCDDGSFCLLGKSCSAGQCRGGTSRSCDDGNSCTADTCDESAAACRNTALGNGASCDDGDYCTVGEVCASGACGGGAARPCDDANPCTTDSCDGAARQCQHVDAADGIPCDDGGFCVVAKSCAAGVCSGGTARDCADASACTFDSCNEGARRCDHDAAAMNGDPCDDGLFCTVGESCGGGVCSATAARDCADANSCTTDTCNETADRCDNTYRGDGAACEDGAFCTTGDRCGSGVCQPGAATPCADGNPCTFESCDEASDVCDFACAPAGVECLDANQEATCDGTCAAPVLRVCGFGCNLGRGDCNECNPSSTRCVADVSLLCNAEVACDADGLVASRSCCGSNRCTCDGRLCLEDVCAGSPDLSAGGTLAGDTCNATDDIPGDCAPGGVACRAPASGGAPEDFFQIQLDDGAASSTFYTVSLDTTGSALDSRLRVTTVCGSEPRQVPSAEVCAASPATAGEAACIDVAGRPSLLLCGLPEGTYYGAVDSAAGTCGGYSLGVAVTPVTLDVPAQAGNISRGGVFAGTTCGLADNFRFPDAQAAGSCGVGPNNCAGGFCPACDATAANDCRVDATASLCSYDGRGGPDAVFYLALEMDSGVDISTVGSGFDTVLYLMESGGSGASPPGDVRLCNDDCFTSNGASHIQTTLPAGLYYVYLDGAGGACGDYVLTVTVSPSATCPNLACEPPFEDCRSCSPDCRCQNCGDGAVDVADGEVCDDGGTGVGDGCSEQCVIEPGYKCAGAPSVCMPHCGDGVIDAGFGEACDDGGVAGGDGCSALCAIEAGFICEGEPSWCQAGTRITVCPGTSIPDGNATGISSDIVVSDTFTIGDVTADVNIPHQDIGDLRVTLRSPAGTTLTLHNYTGFTQNLIGNYDESLTPAGPGTMNGFNGQGANGTWTLTVIDSWLGSTGSLDCWGLNIAAQAACGNGLCDFGEDCTSCGADCLCANCGNGLVEQGQGEGCDDGGTAGGDGCDAGCAVENGYACTGQPSTCRLGVSIQSCPSLIVTDGDAAGVSTTLNVPSSFSIFDATVDVEILHTWKGDLVLDLIAPDNTTVRLHNRTGSSADDIVGNYDLTLVPDGPGGMNDLRGHASQGNWRLFAADYVFSDQGTIVCWTLNLTASYVCPNGTCETAFGENCGNCAADCGACMRCPNGAVNPEDGEQCDDGGAAAGDGCSPTCTVESGWECSGSPSICTPLCGNGALDAGEGCDDGGLLAGDGCSATCQPESGWICRDSPSLCGQVVVVAHPGSGPNRCPLNKNIRYTGITNDSLTAPSCLLTYVTVDIDIQHTWISDIIMTLTSPAGTTVTLHNQTGGSTDDILGNYDATLPVDGPGALVDFRGQQAQGIWSLAIDDVYSLDDGTLDCWSLRLECE